MILIFIPSIGSIAWNALFSSNFERLFWRNDYKLTIISIMACAILLLSMFTFILSLKRFDIHLNRKECSILEILIQLQFIVNTLGRKIVWTKLNLTKNKFPKINFCFLPNFVFWQVHFDLNLYEHCRSYFRVSGWTF